MMRFRLRTLIVLLLLAFTCGFLTSFLIFEGKKALPPKPTSVVSIKEIKKEATNNDVSYQKQIETLTSQNVELQNQLDVSGGLLNDAKIETLKKEDQIKTLIADSKNHSANDLLLKTFKQNPKSYLSAGQRKILESSETALFPNDERSCDSLTKEVLIYIEANHRKDSIYELQLIQFDSLLAVKDSIIETAKKAYSDLHILFEKSISGGSTTQKENLALQKETKRQRFKSKVLTATLFVLSGFTVNYMLRH